MVELADDEDDDDDDNDGDNDDDDIWTYHWILLLYIIFSQIVQ